MTNSKSKFLIAALLAIPAVAPGTGAHAGDVGPAKWLDAWRYVQNERADTNAAVSAGQEHVATAAGVPLVSIREQIPGVNCAAEALPLAVARPVAFHSCRAATPRSWIALNPTSASSGGARPGSPVG